MVYTETIKSKLQREALREAFNEDDWHLHITLHWRHKDYPIARATKKLNALDAYLGTALVGKRFYKTRNFCKRVKFVGSFGRSSKKHLHAHLLVQLPPNTDKQAIIDLIDDYHKTLQGKDTYGLEITAEDKQARINYILQYRHLPVDENGCLDMSHSIYSQTYEMPTI